MKIWAFERGRNSNVKKIWACKARGLRLRKKFKKVKSMSSRRNEKHAAQFVMDYLTGDGFVNTVGFAARVGGEYRPYTKTPAEAEREKNDERNGCGRHADTFGRRQKSGRDTANRR